MRRTRIILLVLLTITLGVMLALWLVLHLERTQRKVWAVIVDKVEESTCLRLEVEHFSYRVWPARLAVRGLRASDASGGSLSVDSIDAGWRWTEIFGTPTRLRSLLVEGLEINYHELPTVCTASTDDGQTSPWQAFAIDELTVSETALGAAAEGLSLNLGGVGVEGALRDARLDLQAIVQRAAVTRMERTLELADLQATIAAGETGVEVKHFSIGNGPMTGEGAGAVVLTPDARAEGRFAVSPDLPALLAWWDPDLSQRLNPQGRLQITGEATWDTTLGMGLSLSHDGEGVELAGYTLQNASLSLVDGVVTASVAGPGWGRAATTVSGGTRFDLELELVDGDWRPAAEAAGLDPPPWLPPESRLSGHATASLLLPFSVERLQAAADLEAFWPQGRAALRGTANNGALDLAALEIDYLGLQGHAAGTIGPKGQVTASGSALIDDPASITTALAFLAPDLTPPTLSGGPVNLEFDVDGTATEPRLQARVTWDQPLIGDIGLRAIEVSASGSFAGIAWTARVEGPGLSVFEAEGTTDRDFNVAGGWDFEGVDLGEAAALWPSLPLPPVAGSLSGSGEIAVEADEWLVTGALQAHDITAGIFEAPTIDIEFEAGPRGVSVPRFGAAVLEGTVEGAGRVTFADPEPLVDLRLDWQGLRPSAIIDELPPVAHGEVAGSIVVSGPLSSPTADARLEWSATAAPTALEGATLVANLDNGTIRIVSEEVRSSAGPLLLRAELPLGSLERPQWLFPDAPTGAWQLAVDGQRLHLAPVLASTDFDDIPVDAVADLEAHAQWHPGLGGAPQLQLSLLDASVTGANQLFVAQGPVRFAFDGREFVLGDVVLQGEHGHFAVGGSFDAIALEVDASAEGRLDPNLVRLIPYPVSIRQPMDVSVHVNGPVNALGGTITIDHPNGVIVIRDPPVQIADLHLEADIRNGVVDVHEGQARVNEGMVYLGGGWNPAVKQGLVAELEDVLFLLGDGILTKWDGAVAVEPAEDGTALVVGELVLDQGLWDSPFDLAGAFLGGDEEVASADDITHSIALDLDVRGRGGIHVNNNLGTFDLRWSLLEVWGTLAEPHIGGDINILPGGVLRVAGQRIPLRRGLVQFTGDPLVDPLLDIVPEHDVMSSREGTGSPDLTGVAATGLSAGLGTVLGLENTTIRPQDIAIETDSNTGTEFSIGQQLTHSTALFLTTDLRNSQKRTSLLQLWRIPTLPGLTIQAMTRTDPGEADFRLLQRFSWGGTKATANQPQLHKIKLEGEWPASRRKLIKASGLVRDQPWDPFLLFLGTVRLERELANRGFPEARVDGRAEGPESRPKAVFTCETGPRVIVEFTDDKLPEKCDRA